MLGLGVAFGLTPIISTSGHIFTIKNQDILIKINIK
jgi:hypothetical protein